MNIQDLKDSFYAGLRNQIAAINPARTIVIRGVTRPAVAVVENELPQSDGALLETFQLTWSGLKHSSDGLLTAVCEISYAVNGSVGATETASSVLGRGRALAAMDAELVSALGGTVRSLAGFTVFENGGVATQSASGTQVFWGDLAFANVAAKDDRISRAASMEVFGYGK